METQVGVQVQFFFLKIVSSKFLADKIYFFTFSEQYGKKNKKIVSIETSNKLDLSYFVIKRDWVYLKKK